MKIFISYRRQDSEWITLTMYNELKNKNHFRADQLFKDFNTIKAGEDFKVTIEKNLKQCDVLLVVIGKNWLACKDEEGNQRLFNKNDYVCFEIATAIKLGKKIIPVLVDNSTMPSEEELPPSIMELHTRQLVKIGSDNFDWDVVNLVKAIRDSTGERNKFADMAHDVAKGQIDQNELVKPENNSAYAVVCMVFGLLICWLNDETAMRMIGMLIIAGGGYAYFLSRKVKGLWLDQYFSDARKMGKRVRLISLAVPGAGIVGMLIVIFGQLVTGINNGEMEKTLNLINQLKIDSTQRQSSSSATAVPATSAQESQTPVASPNVYIVHTATTIYNSADFSIPSVYTLNENTEVEEIESENGFLKINYTSPEGEQYYGWVSTRDLHLRNN